MELLKYFVLIIPWPKSPCQILLDEFPLVERTMKADVHTPTHWTSTEGCGTAHQCHQNNCNSHFQLQLQKETFLWGRPWQFLSITMRSSSIMSWELFSIQSWVCFQPHQLMRTISTSQVVNTHYTKSSTNKLWNYCFCCERINPQRKHERNLKYRITSLEASSTRCMWHG